MIICPFLNVQGVCFEKKVAGVLIVRSISRNLRVDDLLKYVNCVVEAVSFVSHRLQIRQAKQERSM